MNTLTTSLALETLEPAVPEQHLSPEVLACTDPDFLEGFQDGCDMAHGDRCRGQLPRNEAELWRLIAMELSPQILQREWEVDRMHGRTTPLVPFPSRAGFLVGYLVTAFASDAKEPGQ